MQPCLNLATLVRSDMEEAIRAAAKAGFETVELWAESLEKYLDAHATADLQNLLQTHGMRVSSIGDIESVTFCNTRQLEDLSRRCEHLASVAQATSCPNLVVSASVRPRNVDKHQIVEETTSVIGRLLDIVEPKGVNLAFAFRAFDWCAVNSLAQISEAIQHHAGRQIGLALDTFDLHVSGVQPDMLKSIDLSHILVVRMSDCENVSPAILTDADRVLPGEGVANIDAMMEAFAEAGYAGDVSLKILSRRIWEIDAAEAAQVIMAVAEKYLPGRRTKADTEK